MYVGVGVCACVRVWGVCLCVCICSAHCSVFYNIIKISMIINYKTTTVLQLQPHHLHLHIHLPQSQTTITQCKLLKCQCIVHMDIPPPPHTATTNADHHHTEQVTRVQVHYFHQCLDEKAPPVQVAEGSTTTCANGLSALMAEWNSTTSASCNWWQPPLVQVVAPVERRVTLQAQDAKIKMHGPKVRAKVQKSGPASALVWTECSKYRQL